MFQIRVKSCCLVVIQPSYFVLEGIEGISKLSHLFKHPRVQVVDPVEAEIERLDRAVAEGAGREDRDVVPGQVQGSQVGAGQGVHVRQTVVAEVQALDEEERV